MYVLACKKCFVLYCESKQTKTVVWTERETTYAIVVSFNWSFESRNKWTAKTQQLFYSIVLFYCRSFFAILAFKTAYPYFFYQYEFCMRKWNSFRFFFVLWKFKVMRDLTFCLKFKTFDLDLEIHISLYFKTSWNIMTVNLCD